MHIDYHYVISVKTDLSSLSIAQIEAKTVRGELTYTEIDLSLDPYPQSVGGDLDHDGLIGDTYGYCLEPAEAYELGTRLIEAAEATGYRAPLRDRLRKVWSL